MQTTGLYIVIDMDIFNRNWVDTRWQQYSTHLHTNKKETYVTIKTLTIHGIFYVNKVISVLIPKDLKAPGNCSHCRHSVEKLSRGADTSLVLSGRRQAIQHTPHEVQYTSYPVALTFANH
jgi:hypothetical protein